MRCRILHYSFLVLLAALLLTAPVRGQGYCELKHITVEPVTNGLIIHLQADGLMDAAYQGNLWSFTPQQRIAFTLNKVRSGADAVVEIGQYPVSHLEFARPTGLAPDEDRLECTLVLYTPACLTAFPNCGDVSGSAPTDKPQVLMAMTEQGNELLIMVMSNRPQEPPRAQTGAGATPRLDIHGTPDKLSLDVVNTPFTRVIAALSHYTDVPIYLDDQVQQHVSAHLDAMSLPRLLKALTTGYALSLNWQDQAFYVSSGKANTAPAYWAAATRTVSLHYLTPEEAQSLLPDAMLPLLHPNNDLQAVVLSGAPQLVEKMAHDLAVLDSPADHVRVRAWIITCQGSADELRAATLALSSGSTQGTGASTGGLTLALSKGQVDNVLATFQSLSSHLDMQIKTVPEIIVLNGHSANLFFGQDRYFWQLTGGVTLTLSSVQVGAQLSIQPQSSGEWVTTAVSAEDDFLQETNALGPVVVKETIGGTVRIRSGDTMLIGGMQLNSRDYQHGRVLPSWWPGGDILSQHNHSDAHNEVWVLLQAETTAAPATRPMPAFEATGVKPDRHSRR